MLDKLRRISLENWILISMVLGLVFGLSLNLFVSNPFIKDTILMNNIFYLGGNIFIRLLKMLVVPLVFFAIIVGVTSISDSRKIAIISGRTLLLYFITSLVGVSIAIAIGFLFKPGFGIDLAITSQTPNATLNTTTSDLILDIIPENPLNALANGEMLPVIIFAIIVGFILVMLKDNTQIVNGFFEESNKIMMAMTKIVIKIAPIGVFCLMARTFGTLGFESFLLLAKFMGCVLLGLAVESLVVYPILLIIYSRINPIRFYRKFISVIFFAFSTLSSNVTIPLSMNKLEEIGVSSYISSFTIPLGATINKNGTTIMQGVAVMFVSQVLGMNLGFSAILTAIFMIIMASTSTPSVPFSGLATLTLVFTAIGLPVDMIGLMISIDHILDMFRTAVNIIGDAICTIIVANRDNSFDKDVFENKKEPLTSVPDMN